MNLKVDKRCEKCGSLLRRSKLGGVYCPVCNEYKTKNSDLTKLPI